ncbi:MAG: hypothetical protein CMQ28_00780 [Gammaproteobacteria bacterium]|nr:hypothetical protein [Gammaproteobacteria bacterium]
MPSSLKFRIAHSIHKPSVFKAITCFAIAVVIIALGLFNLRIDLHSLMLICFPRAELKAFRIGLLSNKIE